MSTFDLFRLIDRWLGMPLCWVFSLLVPFQKFFRRIFPVTPNDAPNVLVIKLVEIGAVVHAYPFFKQIEKKYPKANIYILTFSKNKEIFSLFQDSVSFKNILMIREDNFRVMAVDIIKAVWKLSLMKIDICVDLEFFSRASAIFTFFSGASKTIGFCAYGFEGLYRGDFLTHKVFYNPLAHTAVNYLALADAISKKEKNSPEIDHYIDKSSLVFPSYRSVDEVRDSLVSLNIPVDKRIFLMNLGEGNIPLREWPVHNFKTVAEAILKSDKHLILLVGTKDARPKAEELMRELSDERLRNYCGQTSLKQLMEIFLIGDALIANDGGLGHLAMLTPIKKYILYGPETPQVFSPLGSNTHVFYSHWPCSPCLSALNHRYSACRDNQCLKAITPEHVINAIKL